MVAGNSNSGDVLREITADCGFEVDEEGASVIDHLNYDVSDQGKVLFLRIKCQTKNCANTYISFSSTR